MNNDGLNIAAILMLFGINKNLEIAVEDYSIGMILAVGDVSIFFQIIIEVSFFSQVFIK